MRCFYVVTKLLMLKLLLASIAGLQAYDFGYHPSAEEFDNFVRETKRTWTRDLLANEHRRALTVKPPFRDAVGRFMPKYTYDKERLHAATKPTTSWPGHVQRVGRPESPNAAVAAHAQHGNVVGSSLNFNIYSGEQTANMGVGEVNAAELQGLLTFNSLQTHAAQQSTDKPPHARPQRPIKQTLSSVIEIDDSGEAQMWPTNLNQSLVSFYNNRTETHAPIYFSNPATGIIYAITEVGRVPDNVSRPDSSNNKISLYIPWEQYERDLYLQRKHYETNCSVAPAKHTANRGNSTHVTVISAAMTTTVRPEIIRLQRPSISKLPIAKLTTHLHKPPPVMVQSELTISDQVELPTRKHKTKVRRKNKKKPNRPGRKPTVSNTGQPQIIKGVRGSTPKPQTSTEQQQVATQLEKPNYTQNVFSKTYVEYSESDRRRAGQSDTSEEHHVRKRSATNMRAYMDRVHNMTLIDKYLQSPVASTPSSEATNLTSQSTKKSQGKGKPRLKVGNYTEISTLSSNSVINRTHLDVPTQPKRVPNTTDINNKQLTNNKPAIINETLNNNSTTDLPIMTLSTSHNVPAKRITKTKIKRKKAKVEKRGKYDLFDFGADDDYDEGDDDNDNDNDDDGVGDDGDSYENDEESYYEYAPTSTKRKQLIKHKQYKPPKNPERFVKTKDYAEHTAAQTTDNNSANSIIIDNGSSAEPNADFGAMGSEESVLLSPPTAITKTTSTSTNTKRIRRRPSTSDSLASNEDYEYDDDDVSSGGGIAGFFRMIFYPVQVLMNGVTDNFSNKESEDEQYSYPTYTTYNNGIQPIASDEEAEEEQSHTLASWLSSWFGFNRRMKNIGSTTPLTPPPATPTQPLSWFDSWLSFVGQPTAIESATEAESESGKWFFGWFDSKPKRRRKTTTTTTTMRTPIAQVPVLTIVDPLKNPQNWIGILAHHIINSTSSTISRNPNMNPIPQPTINPDVPRKITYERYQIWRLKPFDDTQVHALEDYRNSEDGIKLQWLKGPSLRGLTDVLVPPNQMLNFEASLSFESIAHEVLIYDVGKAIAYEQAQEQFHFNAAMTPHKYNKNPLKQQAVTMAWHKYYEYDDIITHLEMLRMRHPQLIELIHIGRSYEGRPLMVVKIESKERAASVASQAQVAQKKLKSKKQPNEANSVFIESGTHGLEWIGPATSLWMISELLRLIKSNKTTIDNEYIKNTTWYFMPILNPDGYVYSHKYDRFWRKTRSRHIARRNGIIDSAMTWLQQKKAATRVCYGVDLDRNWHYQWGKRGSSKAPCNELYAGPGPFSEPESKALSEFLIDYRKQIKIYISLQAYGQIISYPLKSNTSFNAERSDDFLDVAMVGTDGLRKQGSKSRYKIDSTSDLVETRSGCSDAFAAYEVGIPFSFTIQLADNGVHGYLLPSASIEPTARDAFEIITAMVDYI